MENGTLIHSRFEDQARRRPDALAVSSDLGTLTYGRLAALSTHHAARIDRAAPGQAGVVAILAERGPHLVAAMLACARAGRPFVVLDRSYPAARLQSLVALGRPVLVLLAGDGAADSLADPDLPALAIDLGVVDPEAPRLPAISADAPAYLLFTSGSTGAPKGVACAHRPLVNFVDWQARTFGLSATDRFTMLSGLSHDPILRDVFTPLSLGASIHIPAQASLTAPGGLAAWFARVRPTVAHMTPQLGYLLTASGRHRFGDLRYVFWGGDVLRRGTTDALAALAPSCESVNFYGATETPQAAAFHRVSRRCGDDRIPIGQGVDGFTLGVVDEHGGPAPDGERGEIVVRSPFLTLGYVRDGCLPAGPPAQTYATGDIGVRRPDGAVEILGRRDDQVKVRGYRVELAEITTAALRAAGVAQAITLNLGPADQVRLGCFVEPHAGARLDSQVVRAALAEQLPAYMVPDEVVLLPALPLLPNGKVDRQALLARQESAVAAPVPRARALNPVERALVDHWRSLFPGKAIGPDSTFASLGGDSLSYVSAYLAAEEALGAVPDGWTTRTIAELAGSATAAPAKRGLFATVESAILLRALAIAAVVASHFQLIETGDGATGALIWVSGFLFGGLQLREMAHQSSLAPIGRILKSLLIPLYLIELPQVAVKFAAHYHAVWSGLALTTDLIDYTRLPVVGPNAYGGHEYLMWYVHCIVHILLLYAALFAGAKVLLKLRRPAVGAAVAAVALGVLGRFVAPLVFVPNALQAGVNPLSIFGHSPLTYLATFALAALTGFLQGRRRLACLAATLVYAAAGAPLYGMIGSLAVAGVAALVLFAPKLALPRVLSRPIYLVAGASFFIYLLQFKFLAVFSHFGAPAWVAWIGATAGGVAIWSGWTWATQKLAALQLRHWRRPAFGLRLRPQTA
jgi:amino acid adenylation domain-containing protein